MPGKVQLIIDADSKQAQKELASFKKAAQDTTGQITKLDRAASSQHLNAFEKKLAKNTAATRYFGGETKALEKQQRMLRREIERLIRKGMDPLDDTIVQLKRKYDSTGDTLSRLTKKHKTFFASTAKGKSAVSGFIRSFLPIASAGATIGIATNYIRKAGDAFEDSQAKAQKFAITYQGIVSEADQAVTTLADTFKYAESTMMAILADTGDVLSGFGMAGEEALAFAERAAHLGSALSKMNPTLGDAALATEDLTKLMTGEGESMKKWGVVVQENAVQAKLLERGQKDLTGQALLQAKALARLDLAYEQSQNALKNVTEGTTLAADVERRYNEAWKERKEIVGEAVTNFFTPIKLQIAQLVEQWNDATQARKNYLAYAKNNPVPSEIQQDSGGLEEAYAYAQEEFQKALDFYKRVEESVPKGFSSAGAGSSSNIIASAEDRLETAREYLENIKQQIYAQERIAWYEEKANRQAERRAGWEAEISERKLAQKEAMMEMRDIEYGGDTTNEFFASLKSAETVEEATAALETQFAEIDRLAAGYEKIGKDFDAVEQKTRYVASAFESLAKNQDVTSWSLQQFIRQYQEFLTSDEDPEKTSVAEALSTIDKQAFELMQTYEKMGTPIKEQEAEMMALEEVYAQFAETGEYTEWELYQIKKALEEATEAAREGEYTWEDFGKTMSDSLGQIIESFGASVAEGEMDWQGAVGSVISGVGSAAKMAFPQFSWAISLGESALKGLNAAIFGTSEAAKEAQETIEDQEKAVRDLFLDVLDLEKDLADQRLEAIQDEIDLVQTNRDLRLEVLKQQFDRGEITGSEYFEQATAINEEAASEEEAYSNQADLIEGVQSAISTLKDEKKELSGWTKFWTSSDEDLKDEIASYKALLNDLRSDEDGLTDEEVSAIASKYDIEIPAAAKGANFITDGPQLIQVGDNPGGKELVQVTPMSSPNYNGPQQSQDLHIHIDGPVYGIDDLYMQLEQAGKQLKRLGRVRA